MNIGSGRGASIMASTPAAFTYLRFDTIYIFKYNLSLSRGAADHFVWNKSGCAEI